MFLLGRNQRREVPVPAKIDASGVSLPPSLP